MTLTNIRQYVLLGLLSGYLLLNYSFMQFRIPPQGFGIPLGEMFLLFVLMTIDVPLILRKIGTVAYLLPFLVWWGFGFGRMLIDSMDRGFWAFRDATPLIESLFIIVGFALAGNAAFFERLRRWLPLLLLVASIYALGYPIEKQIIEISPTIQGASADQAVPIFGAYDTTAPLLLWTAVYLLCFGDPKSNGRVLRILGAGAAIAFAIVVVQARTIYVQIVGLSFIFLLFRRRALMNLSATIPLLVLAVAVIAAFDISVSGRLTDKISFSFFADHLTAIFGETSASDAAANAAAEGVGLRFGWWQHLYELLTSDAVNELTGLGYGIPLTDFYADSGTLVREPHNSYISVVSRLGVIGFCAWAWMNFEILKVWFGAYREAKRLRWRYGQNLLLQILSFGVLVLITALGEDALEKPYNAIPFYVFWGIALRIGYLLQVRRKTVEKTRSAQAAAQFPRLPAPRPAFARQATQLGPSR